MEYNSSEYDFSLLPPHVIAQILNNLTFRQILIAARTCKAWHFASCDPLILNRVRVRIRNQFDRGYQLTRPFGSFVLSGINFNEFNSKEIFTKFGHCITEIEFINCTLSAKQLFDCLIYMPNLSTFKITPILETFESTVNLDDLDIDPIKPILNRIQYFGVQHHNPNIDGLLRIMNLMPNLKSLCFGPSDLNVNEPFKGLFSYTNLCKLENVEVENLSMASMAGFFQDFSRITEKLNLNSLALRMVYNDILRARNNDTSETFENFCKKFSNLKILSMHSVGENQLVGICSQMQQLIELNLFGITTHQIHVIGSLQNLQKLSLKHFSVIVHEDEAEMFATLENLTDLEVDYEISDVVLNKICINCKNLTRLNLSRMRTINLEVLYKNLLQLQDLDLEFPLQKSVPFHVDSDITNLTLLKRLNVNVLVPGMSLDLFQKLPNLKSSSLQYLKYKFEIIVKRPPLLLAGVRGVNSVKK